MKKRFLHLLILALCLCMITPAQAEDCFTLDVDTLDMDRLNSSDYVQRMLSSSTQGIRVRKYISQSSEVAAYVRLTLTQMDTGSLLFDKDYGYNSGTFDSGVIYLPYAGDHTTPYLVTLYVGEYVYAMPFMHLQRRLSYNGACTAGVRMQDLDASASGDWLMGTVVDLDDLRSSGSTSVDVCASNSCIIGSAKIAMDGSRLRVTLRFDGAANVEVHSQTLYVATDGQSLHSAAIGSTGEWIDVGSASAALIYLPMQVSYDPAGLPSFFYNPSQRQMDLWRQSRSSAPAEEPFAADSWADSGWSGNGWSDDGWSNDGWDADYGWDDGWASDAPGWE